MNACKLTALVALLPVSIADPQALRPQRVVVAHAILSSTDPPLKISVPKNAKYLGADVWVLYGVANCEVHLFVEADAEHVIKRFYWIQFEHYVPTRPELHYDYTKNATRRAGDRLLYVKARFGPSDDQVKSGSEVEHVRTLIRNAGYTMPPGMINVRLVDLPDTDHRQEVMVIYAEDAALSGVGWNDLLPGARSADRWDRIAESLTRRALQKIRFSDPQ